MSESFRKAFKAYKTALADPSIKTATLLIGVAAAGKSTYVKNNPDPTTVFFDTVAARPSFRKAAIRLAKEAGKTIKAVYIDTSLDVCIERNAKRDEHRRVPVEALKRAADGLTENPPNVSEGFSEVIMPLRRTSKALIESCSIEALEKNIATEVRSGTPREQALAIAFSTLRDACKEEGKPVPKRTKKAKPRTSEFLNAALKRAKEKMDPRDFAIIHQAARSSAGGTIAARNRKQRKITALESQLIEKRGLGSMSSAELESISASLNKLHERDVKNTDVLKRADRLAQEMLGRGMLPDGRVYVALEEYGKGRYSTKKVDAHGCKSDERYVAGQGCVKRVSKGFLNQDPEGGMHAHGLDRRHSKTFNDGGHLHLWVMPGSGELVISNEDGFHEHAIDGDKTATDGQHSHKVQLPSGDVAETSLGGIHSHQLMVETSGFDGLHKHALILPDGTEVQSLSPAEFVESLASPPEGAPLPSASEISGAMMSMRRIFAESALPTEDLPPLPEAVLMSRDGKNIPIPAFAVETTDGDIVDIDVKGEFLGISKHVEADSEEFVAETTARWDEIRKHTRQVPFTGPKDAPLLFIAGAPNELELARRQGFVGEDALAFQKTYLSPLNLKKSDVGIGFAMPVLPLGSLTAELCREWSDHLVGALKTYSKAKVVAIGKTAREVLTEAGIKCYSMPHPTAIRKGWDTEEVSRKIRLIAKALDVTLLPVQDVLTYRKSGPSQGHALGTLAEAISKMRKMGSVECRITKSNADLQIVYGVVLDPYRVDLEDEWVPPAEVQSTAHGFQKQSRVIGFEHLQRANAQLVESFIEPYPSNADYQAALRNEPHSVTLRQYGNDWIHSGTWVAGVELGDKEWAQHSAGELDAFSVGGFSFKTNVALSAMPEIEIIKLIGVPT